MPATPTEKSGGTHTPSALDTPETLIDTTDAGFYVLTLDLSNLAAGDQVVVRTSKKPRVGATLRDLNEVTFTNVQAEPLKEFLPVLSYASGQYKVTLEQTDGTIRSFVWSVGQL